MATEALEVGLPLASKPGVITIFDTGVSFLRSNTPSADGSTWNCVLAFLITPFLSLIGPNTYPFTKNCSVCINCLLWTIIINN